MKIKLFKNPMYGAMSVCLFLTAQQAVAHTEIQVPIMKEGTGLDNALTISHGCEAKERPIHAQSVMFPTQNPELIASDGHSIADLSEIIDQSLYAGQVDLIQNKNIFQHQDEKHDALGNSIGFWGTDGTLQANLQGRVPFQFVAPNFNPSSCATALSIEVAIADICIFSAPTIRAPKVNLWIPDNGSQYAVLGKAQGVEGIGDPAVLQVKRNLIKNPLNPSCGKGFTVTVRPSAADVDANLGIPGWHY
ncbi:MAG: hypothetical protein PHR16_12465 [Methylovulum sp.]|nr:hypothetical protein [Methylovulum sp.]